MASRRARASARVAAGLAAGTSDKEYLPIEGHAEFRRLSAQLVLGPESPALREGRCATLQTISGTGAVSVAATAPRLIGGLAYVVVLGCGALMHGSRAFGMEPQPELYTAGVLAIVGCLCMDQAKKKPEDESQKKGRKTKKR